MANTMAPPDLAATEAAVASPFVSHAAANEGLHFLDTGCQLSMDEASQFWRVFGCMRLASGFVLVICGGASQHSAIAGTPTNECSKPVYFTC